jgi:hypothetical protein
VPVVERMAFYGTVVDMKVDDTKSPHSRNGPRRAGRSRRFDVGGAATQRPRRSRKCAHA